ncbi:hypothetical protein ACOSP7_030601 [Xanthoceras sorbifolium]
MKFLLELVSCCGCGCQESGGGVETKVPPEPRTEETRSLVASVRRSYRRKGRGRSGGVASGSAEWKPSLCVISEENVVMEKDKSETERVAKRKSGGSHKDRARVRSYSHEFRGNSMSTIIPTFSATPFMF